MITKIFVFLLVVASVFSQTQTQTQTGPAQCLLPENMLPTCPTTVMPVCGFKTTCKDQSCGQRYDNACLACKDQATLDVINSGLCTVQDWTLNYCMPADRVAQCDVLTFDMVQDPVCGYGMMAGKQNVYGTRCLACADPSVLYTKMGYCYGFDGEQLNDYFTIFEDQSRYFCNPYPGIDGQNKLRDCSTLPTYGKVCGMEKLQTCASPPCWDEFDSGCMACNNKTISDYIPLPCANITMQNLTSQYCKAAERNVTTCDMTSMPVCGNSFRWMFEDGVWRSSNGTLLPADGSWKPKGNLSSLPGDGEWIDGEWFGSTQQWGNFMNNFQKTNYMNRCHACQNSDIDYVEDGECKIYVPIPIPVILPGIGMNNTKNTLLPLVAGQPLGQFSFCPDVLNMTACPPETPARPVCGLMRQCPDATASCSKDFVSGCLACQNKDIGMVVNGTCTLGKQSINKLAVLWKSRTAIKKIKCTNRCTTCPANANAPKVCAYQFQCPANGKCFNTMNSACLACKDATIGFYYEGACETVIDNTKC